MNSKLMRNTCLGTPEAREVNARRNATRLWLALVVLATLCLTPAARPSEAFAWSADSYEDPGVSVDNSGNISLSPRAYNPGDVGWAYRIIVLRNGEVLWEWEDQNCPKYDHCNGPSLTLYAGDVVTVRSTVYEDLGEKKVYERDREYDASYYDGGCAARSSPGAPESLLLPAWLPTAPVPTLFANCGSPHGHGKGLERRPTQRYLGPTYPAIHAVTI